MNGKKINNNNNNKCKRSSLQFDVGQLLWGNQALGVSLLAKASLFEGSDESGQLVFGLGRGNIDLLQVIGEKLVDLGFKGVEGFKGLLKNVADHDLSAVISVKLKSRVKHTFELLDLSLPLSENSKNNNI